MAHEIMQHDTMLSANDVTPWHRLVRGAARTSADQVRIAKGPITTAAEALRLSGLGWTVSLAELETVANGHPSQPVDMARAVRRDDTGQVLGVVGTSFRVLQNDRAFAAFDRWSDAGVLSYETAGSLRNGARVWILARVNVPDMEIGKGDTVQPYALLAHGHDGSLAVRVQATAVRVVCANTLAAAMFASSIERNFRHVGDVGAKADEAIAALDNVRAAAAKQTAVYRALAEAGLPTKRMQRDDAVLDYLAAVWDVAADELAERQRAIDVADLFDGAGKGSDLATARDTWWGLYQALAEYVTHSRGRTEESRAESSVWGGGANELRRGIAVAWAMGREGLEPAYLQSMSTDAIEQTIAASLGKVAA